MSKNAKYCRIMSHIAEYCRILSNNVEYCRIMSNNVEYCRTLSKNVAVHSGGGTSLILRKRVGFKFLLQLLLPYRTIIRRTKLTKIRFGFENLLQRKFVR